MKFIVQRHFIHWIAILAILMGAVAPTISQAVSISEHGKAFTVEICTTSGVKMTQIIGGNSADDHQTLATEHCAYCVVHTVLALPIDTTLDFAVPQTASLYPQLFYQSPKPLFAWVKIPSQAPPQLA